MHLKIIISLLFIFAVFDGELFAVDAGTENKFDFSGNPVNKKEVLISQVPDKDKETNVKTDKDNGENVSRMSTSSNP